MDDKEWDDFPRQMPGLTVIPWLIWVLVILMVVMVTKAFAGPIAEGAGDNGAKITLYNDPCKLKEITNLANRATWNEKGKVWEGCFGIHPYGVVLAYFNDGTVVIMPVDIFKQVSGA